MRRFLLRLFRRCASSSALAFVLVPAPALAQSLPVARLFSVFPPGGQQGTTVEVNLAGIDLEKVSRLHFSTPGVAAVQNTAPPGLGESGPQGVPGKFTLTIAPDAKPGLCEVRAIGKYGVSNPRTFVIGGKPEIVEVEPNNSADKATEVAQGSVVNALSNSATDQDYFRFSAKAGQRVLVDCWAYRIDSRMDATLVLYDATGKELARNRDTNRRDPFLDFVVPADGVYFVEVSDFLYAGNSEFFYRLSIDTGAYLDFVMPPAGVPGSTATYTIYGRNLPGGQPTSLVSADGKPLESLAVAITLPADQSVQDLEFGSVVEPEESGIDGMSYRLSTPAGLSNALLLGFAAAPIVVEQEPNDDPAQAQPVTAPCEFVGQFYPQTDRDWVTFQAKAGEALWIEVTSQRLGLPTDPFLLIQQVTTNDKGEQQLKDVQGVDDFLEDPPGPGRRGMSIYDMKTDDPAFRFTAPADGVYRVLVRNLSNYSRPDPRFVYRLAIHAARPDFRLVAKPRLLPFSPDPNQNPPTVWSPLLRKGGTEWIDVMVFRNEGFDGEVTVAIDGLPPGVTAAPVTIGAGQFVGSLVLAAAEDAPESMSLVTILGKARIGESEVVRPARSASMVWGGALNQVTPRTRLTRNLAVAVSGNEVAPFFVDTGAGRVLEMCKSGKIELPVKLVRRGDFKGDIALATSPLPPNVKQPTGTIGGAAAEGKLEVALPANAPVGTYTFSVLGTSQVSYSRDPEAVKEATDRKAAVDKIVADLTAAAKAATEAKSGAEKKAAETTMALQKAKEMAQAAGAAAQQAGETDKAATEAKLAADKAAADAELQAKAAADAKAAAEKAAAEAEAKVKEAAGVAAAVAKAVEAATNQAKPKAINLSSPSPTVTLKITPAPIALAATSPAHVKPGATLEVPVTITRLYGYNDAVQLNVKLPATAKGLKVADVTIPAGQSQAKLVVETAADAAAGSHALNLVAVSKFNGQDLSVAENVTVTIAAVETVAAP